MIRKDSMFVGPSKPTTGKILKVFLPKLGYTNSSKAIFQSYYAQSY